MPVNSLRDVSLDCLMRVEKEGAYSHLVVNHAIQSKQLTPKDEGLLTEIVYGTIQRQLTLDYLLKPFIAAPKKMMPWVHVLLRLSIYQMVYLDRIPDYAIIDEAVNIAKMRGHKGISSFVNGVLRHMQRGPLPDTSKIETVSERIAIETSHPEWLVNEWLDMYGQAETEAMCRANMLKKPLSVRVQPLKITRQAAMNQLTEEGLTVKPSSFSTQGIVIEKGNVLKTELFQNNLLTVQDQSSMLVGEMINVKPGMTVLDACSAPGGKATHIAEKMADKGQLFAYDIHHKKARLVQQKAEQLGLSILSTGAEDARKLANKHGSETFDRILIDAPCSGLGVLRGKPEIKYNKTAADIDRLATIQFDILMAVSPLLKKGGLLVYSTCTVNQKENEQVINRFIQHQTNMQVDETFFQELPESLQYSNGQTDYGLQLFPQTWQTDGFFLSRLRKL